MAYLSMVAFFWARYTLPKEPLLMGFSMVKSWMSREPNCALGILTALGGVPSEVSEPSSSLNVLRGRKERRSSSCRSKK